MDGAEECLGRRDRGRRRLVEELYMALDREVQSLGRDHIVDETDLLARAAENRAPLRQSSRAAERPILRTTNGEIMPGRIPRTTSVNPKIASSAATTTSQTAASPEPPPSAAPWMRPITGTGIASIA